MNSTNRSPVQPESPPAVSVLATDGEVLIGKFLDCSYTEIGTWAIDEVQFLSFESLDGKVHLLNRKSITRIVPHY